MRWGGGGGGGGGRKVKAQRETGTERGDLGSGVGERYVSMSHRQQQQRAVQQAVRHVSPVSSLLLSSTTYTTDREGGGGYRSPLDLGSVTRPA